MGILDPGAVRTVTEATANEDKILVDTFDPQNPGHVTPLLFEAHPSDKGAAGLVTA